MRAEYGLGEASLSPAGPPESLPTALFRHHAWHAWKAGQGWKRLAAVEIPGYGALPLLWRPLGMGASMAWACGSPPTALLRSLPGGEAVDEGDCGAALEELSLLVRPRLPEGTVFLRWDLSLPAWTDSSGDRLDSRLQELRMNASTRKRAFRKAPGECLCPDTAVVDLSGGRDAVEARMESRARYSVRLARRRGTRVLRTGVGALAEFHELHRMTAARQGLRAHSAGAFRSLFEAAEGSRLGLDLYLARSGERTAAAAVIARLGEDAWYLFAASSHELRDAAGPTAILHQALMDGAEEGAARMDLMGVGPKGSRANSLAGLSLFKAGFGGSPYSRMGSWDFVVREDLYGAWAVNEALWC